jgi:hypothetical protein
VMDRWMDEVSSGGSCGAEMYLSPSSSSNHATSWIGVDQSARFFLETLPRRVRPFVLDLVHLVIVPGHGIWTGAQPEDAEVEDSSRFTPEGMLASVRVRAHKFRRRARFDPQIPPRSRLFPHNQMSPPLTQLSNRQR